MEARYPQNIEEDCDLFSFPGAFGFGSIWIPGSDKKSRYTFRVLFWDEERERLVCTHSAQGDEQTFYLHVEDHDDDDRNKEEDRLIHIISRQRNPL